VTMPRVKALTTGTVPSFVDLILNFAESDTTSSLASQDTWLAQIRAHLHGHGNATGDEQGKLYFYGDDTWLKLFPHFFAHHDGTTSFFVSVSYSIVSFKISRRTHVVTPSLVVVIIELL